MRTLEAKCLGVLSLLAAGASAANFLSTCKEIERAISPASEVFYPGSPQYSTDIHHFYETSTQNSTCSVEPGTPKDAAKILTIIGQRNTPYAVKSGGHAINPGFSDTAGVQISLSRFNQSSFNSTTGTAKIGPGQVGERVYQALEPFNVTVAAGRVSGVGVGGFTLGGGYSWVANQVGLSCDTVVEFEVALPTGKVVTATNTSNADLFFGLKGGGNNFGIVTAITYKAVEQPAVWGGVAVVSGEGNITSLSEAVNLFQDTNKDPKAVVTAAYNFDPSLGGLIVSVLYYYHGPSPPPGTFDRLLAVPTISSSLSVTSLTRLVSSLTSGTIEGTPRALWRAISIKNYTLPLLQEIVTLVKTNGPIGFNRSAVSFSLVTEPMLDTVFDHQPNGPAAYFHPPGKFLAPSVVYFYWTDPADDAFFFDLLKSIQITLRDFAASAEGGFQPVEPPEGILYPNYAPFDTPTSLLFGPNLPQLRAIQNKYDPKGVTKLTSGWKF